jgi:hypothetical protein
MQLYSILLISTERWANFGLRIVRHRYVFHYLPGTPLIYREGFLATSYVDGSLFVVDMRQPRVMFRSGVGGKAKNRYSILSHHGGSKNVITALKWTVCPIGSGMSIGLPALDSK